MINILNLAGSLPLFTLPWLADGGEVPSAMAAALLFIAAFRRNFADALRHMRPTMKAVLVSAAAVVLLSVFVAAAGQWIGDLSHLVDGLRPMLLHVPQVSLAMAVLGISFVPHAEQELNIQSDLTQDDIDEIEEIRKKAPAEFLLEFEGLRSVEDDEPIRFYLMPKQLESKKDFFWARRGGDGALEVYISASPRFDYRDTDSEEPERYVKDQREYLSKFKRRFCTWRERRQALAAISYRLERELVYHDQWSAIHGTLDQDNVNLIKNMVNHETRQFVQKITPAIIRDLMTFFAEKLPWLEMGKDYSQHYRQETEAAFNPSFDLQIPMDEDVFVDRLRIFLNRYPDVEHNNTLLLDAHRRYTNVFIGEPRDRFIDYIVFILTVTTNMHYIKTKLVHERMREAGLEAVYTKYAQRLRLAYNPVHTQFMVESRDSIVVNVDYLAQDYQHFMYPSQFSMNYQVIYRQQHERNALSRQAGPKGAMVEDEYMRAEAFDTSHLRAKDRERLVEVLAGAVALMSANKLVFNKAVRKAGFREALEHAAGHRDEQDTMNIALLLTFAEHIRYPTYDPLFLYLSALALPYQGRRGGYNAKKAEYFQNLRVAFGSYLRSFEFKSDLTIRHLKQEEFNERFPAIRNGQFTYSRSGTIFIVRDNPDNIGALQARGRMLHLYQRRLTELPSIVYAAVSKARDSFKKFPRALDAFLALSIMNSEKYYADKAQGNIKRMAEKRRRDMLRGRRGGFDNVVMEGKRQFRKFNTVEDMKEAIVSAIQRHPDEPLAFIFRFVPGGEAIFKIGLTSARFNLDKIMFTLRGWIEQARKGHIKINFQAGGMGVIGIRDPKRYMVIKGFGEHFDHDTYNQLLHNDVIWGNQRFYHAQIPAETITTSMMYLDQDNEAKVEHNRPLIDLAFGTINKEVWYPLVVDPRRVPMNVTLILGQMLAWYNYLKVRQKDRVAIRPDERDYVEAFEDDPVLMGIVKDDFPLFDIAEEIEVAGKPTMTKKKPRSQTGQNRNPKSGTVLNGLVVLIGSVTLAALAVISLNPAMGVTLCTLFAGMAITLFWIAISYIREYVVWFPLTGWWYELKFGRWAWLFDDSQEAFAPVDMVKNVESVSVLFGLLFIIGLIAGTTLVGLNYLPFSGLSTMAMVVGSAIVLIWARLSYLGTYF